MRKLTPILILMLFGIYVQAQEADSIRVIPPAAFAKEIDSIPEPQLIDVRTAKEYREGHIQGAVHYDVLQEKRFLRQVRRLDRKKPVLLYCRSGKRSHHAAALLQRMGFSEIIELKGGYLAWSSQ